MMAPVHFVDREAKLRKTAAQGRKSASLVGKNASLGVERSKSSAGGRAQ
jgi:hypothetical protein